MSWSNKRRGYFKAYDWKGHQFKLFRALIVSEVAERLSKQLDEAILYGSNISRGYKQAPEFSTMVAIPDGLLPLIFKKGKVIDA